MTREERGANFLDSAYPGWFNKVVSHKICMNNGYACILGQLYGCYISGLGRLKRNNMWAEEHGLDSFGDKLEWIKEINKRKEKDQEQIMNCPTKEQILEAAKENSVKKALEKLFPEVFNNICLDSVTYITSSGQAERAGIGRGSLCVRGGGNFARKGFYLNDCVDWKIVKDSSGCLVLVPEKKQ